MSEPRWKRFILLGFLVWLAGSVTLRLVPGVFFERATAVSIVLLYAISFLAVFLAVSGLARSMPSHDGARAGIGLILPTLLLDAFASAFFPAAYPNLPASAAGVFGGWMLICCGGGLCALLRGR